MSTMLALHVRAAFGHFNLLSDLLSVVAPRNKTLVDARLMSLRLCEADRTTK